MRRLSKKVRHMLTSVIAKEKLRSHPLLHDVALYEEAEHISTACADVWPRNRKAKKLPLVHGVSRSVPSVASEKEQAAL